MSGGLPQRLPQQSQSSSSLRLPSPRGLFDFSRRISPKQGSVENRPSPSRSALNTVCETCQQPVDPVLANICRGCNQHAHLGCHETLTIGETWNMQMCMCCTHHVKHVLRIVRAVEARHYSSWREEEWFQTILDVHLGVAILPETTNESLITLQNFMLNALRDNLHVWQSHSMRTPTTDADPSPTGLPVPAPPKPIPPEPPTPIA